jgi:hypothetical protein
MRRLGFVSNSSSTSFVIPKKYLTNEELEIYYEYRNDSKFGEDDLNIGNIYLYGSVSMHNLELNRIFRKYLHMEGVEFD